MIDLSENEAVARAAIDAAKLLPPSDDWTMDWRLGTGSRTDPDEWWVRFNDKNCGDSTLILSPAIAQFIVSAHRGYPDLATRLLRATRALNLAIEQRDNAARSLSDLIPAVTDSMRLLAFKVNVEAGNAAISSILSGEGGDGGSR